MRRSPIYHSTYTGKPPDEPAMLGVALNEVFVPLLQKQFPEIVDFYLPPEGCSYRLAVVSMKKQYPGPRQARDVRHLELPAAVHVHQVHRGVRRRRRRARLEGSDLGADARASTRRATRTLVENTPIDYLDFASPVSGLGSKMGIDATNKWPGETARRWGRPIVMDDAVKRRVDRLWQDLGSRRLVTHWSSASNAASACGRVRVVRDHHHRVAPAAAVEHVAADRARIREQPGLDVRVARRRASPCRRLRIVPSAATTGSDAMNSGITGLCHAACSSAIRVAALARSLRDRPEPFSITESSGA